MHWPCVVFMEIVSPRLEFNGAWRWKFRLKKDVFSLIYVYFSSLKNKINFLITVGVERLNNNKKEQASSFFQPCIPECNERTEPNTTTNLYCVLYPKNLNASSSVYYALNGYWLFVILGFKTKTTHQTHNITDNYFSIGPLGSFIYTVFSDPAINFLRLTNLSRGITASAVRVLGPHSQLCPLSHNQVRSESTISQPVVFKSS